MRDMDIIPKEEEVEGRHFKRSKDKFGYKIPEVSLDKDICVNIKYGILDISLGGNIIFPKGCGAYVITTESGSVYVGSTKDISKRLKRHISLGNNIIEVMFNGLWYNVEVRGSLGNLFI